MFEMVSEWMSATSFAIRRVRLEDMVGDAVQNFELYESRRSIVERRCVVDLDRPRCMVR